MNSVNNQTLNPTMAVPAATVATQKAYTARPLVAVAAPANAPANAPASAPASAPAGPRPPAAVRPLAGVGTVTSVHRPWFAILVVISFFLALIGTFVIYSFNISTGARLATAAAAVEDVKGQLAAPPYSDIEEQIKLIEQLLNGYRTAVNSQIDYGPFIDSLATVTPKNMTIESLTLDDKGVVRLTGLTNNFESAGKAHLAYKESVYLQNVILESVALNDKDGTVSFSLTGQLRKDRLIPSVTVNQPVAESVTTVAPVDPLAPAAAGAPTPPVNSGE